MESILKFICESGIFFWSILGFILLIILIVAIICGLIYDIYNFLYKNIKKILCSDKGEIE